MTPIDCERSWPKKIVALNKKINKLSNTPILINLSKATSMPCLRLFHYEFFWPFCIILLAALRTRIHFIIRLFFCQSVLLPASFYEALYRVACYRGTRNDTICRYTSSPTSISIERVLKHCLVLWRPKKLGKQVARAAGTSETYRHNVTCHFFGFLEV